MEVKSKFIDKLFNLLYYGNIRKGRMVLMISYKKLRMLVYEKELKWHEVKRKVGVSNDVIAKINKDDYVTLKTLEKFALFLGCDIGDLVEIKKEK